MHPYFKLPDLVTFTDGMLAFIKRPDQTDLVMPKLKTAIKHINQIAV